MKPRLAGTVVTAALLVVAGGGAAAATSPAATTGSTGCRASTVVPGETRITTTSGGAPRAYLRHVPPGYRTTTPFPLVLDLHGHTEPASLHKINSGLGVFGDRHGFVTITPEGSGPPPQWDTRFQSADMRFLGTVLDEVKRSLCIDERRVFVTGYSNGAFMASAMACVYADRFAAVGAVAGIRAVPGCGSQRPVPIVAFHGTADPFVSFNGSLGPGVAHLPAAVRKQLADVSAPSDSGLSVPEVTQAWAVRNGCFAIPTTRSVTKDVVLVRYPCPNNADVELYEITRGGHTWPGSQFSKAIAPVVGRTTFSIDADQIMWTFFQRHPRRSPA